MNWKIQLFFENAAAVLPLQRYRRRLRRRGIKPADRLKLLETTLERAIQQVELMRQHGIDPRGRIGVELGTDWHPLGALVQSLAGAKRIYLVNSTVEYDSHSVVASVLQLSQWSGVLAQRLGIDEAEVSERCKVSGSSAAAQLLERFQLVNLAPCDARHIPLESASVDYVTSLDTLERVPPKILADVITEADRLLYPSGVMCHLIDNSDPWAERDRALAKVNFLRHSEAMWAFCSMNRENYRNRLRHPQYRSLFQNAGFEVLHQSKKVDAKSLSAIRSFRVADSFATIPEKDLCAVSSRFVLQKPAQVRQPSGQPETEANAVGAETSKP